MEEEKVYGKGLEFRGPCAQLLDGADSEVCCFFSASYHIQRGGTAIGNGQVVYRRWTDLTDGGELGSDCVNTHGGNVSGSSQQ